MPHTSMGASIRRGDEVVIAEKSDEKDLSRGLAVSVDEQAGSLFHLADVKDEKDLMQRSPVTGSIDLSREMGGQRLEGLLTDLQAVVGDLQISSTGEQVTSAAIQSTDFFAVQDLDWLESPDELSWQSCLAAQLKALKSASDALLKDPVRADFAKTLSDQERAVMAARARDLASELSDEALGEIMAKCRRARDTNQSLIESTANELRRYTSSAEFDAGGIEATELEDFLRGLGR